LIGRNFGFVQIVKPGIAYVTCEMSDEQNAKLEMAARAYDRGGRFFSRLRYASRLGPKISRIRGKRRRRD
jgi:hypothetical protein